MSSPPNKKSKRDLPFTNVATDTWLGCGRCARLFGLTQLAITLYEAALVHDASHMEGLTGLAGALRAHDIELNQTLGTQKAIDILTRALQAHPRALQGSFEIFKELAECHLLIGLSDQSQVFLHKALELRPDDLSLWLLSGQLLIRLGQPAKANESFKNALFKLPHQKLSTAEVDIARSAHAELAAIAAAEGNIDVATQELMATLNLPPLPLSRGDEHAALWCALLTARERADDINGAIAACENGYRALGTEHPRLLLTHAHLLLLADTPTHNPRAAIGLLEKVIAQEKGETINDGEGDFLPWYLLGKAYTVVDEPTKAYEVYQVAITRAAALPLPWLAVGLLYLQLSQLSDAFEAYSQAAKLQMEDNALAIAPAWEGLACVYERCDNQFVDAADACLRAASCYRAAGDATAASTVEERALVLSQAARKERPPPPVRIPAPPSAALLRDLVNISPSVRIQTVKHQRELQAQAQAQPRRGYSSGRPETPQQSVAAPAAIAPQGSGGRAGLPLTNGAATPQPRPGPWAAGPAPHPAMAPGYYYGPGHSPLAPGQPMRGPEYPLHAQAQHAQAQHAQAQHAQAQHAHAQAQHAHHAQQAQHAQHPQHGQHPQHALHGQHPQHAQHFAPPAQNYPPQWR